jgi:hypothetical protein
MITLFRYCFISVLFYVDLRDMNSLELSFWLYIYVKEILLAPLSPLLWDTFFSTLLDLALPLYSLSEV